MKKLTFLGYEKVTFINELGELYPAITVKDYVESYFMERETTGKKNIEENRWFFQSWDFENKKKQSNKVVSVEIAQFSGVFYEFSAKHLTNMPISIVNGDTEITVRNILSKKILSVPVRLVNKWKDMYQLVTYTDDRVFFDDINIEERVIESPVYSINIEDATNVIINKVIV